MDYAPEDFDDSSSVYSNAELSNDSSEGALENPNQDDQNMVFSLGKSSSGQRVKIDFKNFQKTKYSYNPFKDQSSNKVEQEVSTQDLKTSCLCLIDQLAQYYDNFHDNLKESESQVQSSKSVSEQKQHRERQFEQYQKLQKCMNQTKQFLQIIQTQKGEAEHINQLNFSADQEKVVRELINELKWHLSKFSEDQQLQQKQIEENNEGASEVSRAEQDDGSKECQIETEP